MTKMIRKYAALAAILTAVVLLLASCSGGSVIQKPAADEGAKTYEITGSCWIEKLNDTTLKVHCETNIMNGAVIAVCLDTYTGENLGEETYQKTGDNFYTEFTVDPAKLDGPIFASIVMMPSSHGKQPTEVTAAYGSKLQNISGESVIWNSEGNLVVIMSEEYEL